MRTSVSALGRFMSECPVHSIVRSGGYHEGDSAGRGARARGCAHSPSTHPSPSSPSSIVPFLTYQIDLLKQVPEIDEVVLSLNYQPEAIAAVFGDGSAFGIRMRYVVEPEPLGTGGGIKFASRGIEGPIVVFNGDVLDRDRSRVRRSRCIATVRRARRSCSRRWRTRARSALVETDGQQNIRRFIEKPKPGEITTNRINAGIYVLETSTFDRIPDGVPWSIERKYFPSLIERGETFLAFDYQGYWIDIGTPEKYLQVHHDILAGRFRAAPFRDEPAPAGLRVAPARSQPRGHGREPVLHRRRRDGGGRRAHRPAVGGRPQRAHRGQGGRGGRHRVAGLHRRPRRDGAAARSPAATAGSAPAPLWGPAPCSATRTHLTDFTRA